MPPTAPVLIHSNDYPAANEMARILTAAKWPTWTVAPAENWNWIERDWAYHLAWLAGRHWLSTGDPPSWLRRAN